MGEWSFCGKDIPKSEIVFFSQIIPVYFMVGFSIYITAGNQNTKLWITLLSSCLGYLLPSPGIKRKKNGFYQTPSSSNNQILKQSEITIMDT